MSTVGGVGSTSNNGNAGKGLAEMTGDDFLNLLISELSNQDPFEPMKNKEILEQLSAIRGLQSNMTMSENFQTLINSQQLASATTLIGRTVMGTDTGGELIQGQVQSILLDAGGLRLQIGDRQMKMGNVMRIVESPTAVTP